MLARRVATLVGLDGRQDVLDLGTGPGFLALGFHPYARRVTSIDPEPEMLRVARATASTAKASIDFVEGSSNDLGGIALLVEHDPDVPANAWHAPFQAQIECYAVAGTAFAVATIWPWVGRHAPTPSHA